MPRFLLIDHSLVALGGHHYEYATRVLEAAGQVGYEPILATNRRFESVEALPYRVVRSHRYAIFDLLPGSMPRRKAWRGLERVLRASDLARARLRYSPLLILRWCWRDPEKLERYALAMGPRWRVALPLSLARHAIGLVARSLGGGSKRRSRHGAEPASRDTTGPESPLASRAGWTSRLARRVRLPDWLYLWRKRRAFARDTIRLFDLLEVGEGDLVFVPTLHTIEMAGILDALRRRPGVGAASINLLFRHEPGVREGGGRSAPPLIDPAPPASTEGGAAPALRLWTDTVALEHAHARVWGLDVPALPIPVSGDFAAPAGGREALQDHRLRVVYAGDAREEKGFHHLPALVEHGMARNRRGASAAPRVCFALQANFNVHGGDVPSAVALAQLEPFEGEDLSLIREPLPPRAFRALIESGDVLVMPYAADRYRARSSGVLGEALAAGRPVLVSAGSWLAAQLEAYHFAYHRGVFEDTQALDRCTFALATGPAAPTDGEHAATGRQISHQRPVPARATIASVIIDGLPEGARGCGGTIDVVVDQLDEGDRRIARTRRRCRSERRLRASALIRLQPETVGLTVGVEAPEDQWARMGDHQLSLAFHRFSASKPEFAVGVASLDESELCAAFDELVEHHDHYRRTAAAVAADWRRHHSPGALVAALSNDAYAELWRAKELCGRALSADVSAAHRRERSAPPAASALASEAGR